MEIIKFCSEEFLEVDAKILRVTDNDLMLLNKPFSFADDLKKSLVPVLSNCIIYESLSVPNSPFFNSECSPSALHELLYGSLKNYPLALLNGKTTRQMMQGFGTDFVRSNNDEFWCMSTFNRIFKLMTKAKVEFSIEENPDEDKLNNWTFYKKPRICIIDDLREPVEFNLIKRKCQEYGILFTPIILTREKITLSDTHSSETNVLKTHEMIKELYPDNYVQVSECSNPKDISQIEIVHALTKIRSIILKSRNNLPNVLLTTEQVISEYKKKKEIDEHSDD